MTPIVVVATLAAGALGAVARAWLSGRVQRHWHRRGAGTATVNLLGAFLLGLWSAHGAALGPNWTTLVGIGFLGAFTTFSTWMVELGFAWRSGRRGLAFLEALALLAAGLAAAYAGLLTGAR